MYIEGTTKPRGGYRYRHGIPLLGKKMCLNFQPAKQRYTIDFTPYYGTSASLRYIQQNQEGDTDIPFTVTVYRFMAKNTSKFFLILEDVFSF